MSVLLLLPQLNHLPLPRLFASPRPHGPQLLFSPHLPGPIHLKVLAQFVSDSVRDSLIFHEHQHTSLSLRETVHWTGHSDCRSTLLYFPPMHQQCSRSQVGIQTFVVARISFSGNSCADTHANQGKTTCAHNSATARRPLACPEPGAKMTTVLSLGHQGVHH